MSPIPNDMPTDMGRMLKTPEQLISVLDKLAGGCGEAEACQVSTHIQTGVRLPESWFVSAIGAVIQNALEATGGHGHIRLDAHEETLAQSQPVRFGQPLEAGRYVVVTVVDSGAGFSDKALNRAVEPGFTTKPGHKGMGLSSAYGIVISCKGGLDSLTLPSGETAVSVYFPAHAG